MNTSAEQLHVLNSSQEYIPVVKTTLSTVGRRYQNLNNFLHILEFYGVMFYDFICLFERFSLK